jgi:hypothetical protein
VANNWFPVVTGFIGTGLGAVLGIAADVVGSKRAESLADKEWRRGRAVDAIEAGYDAVATVYSPDRVEYSQWRGSLNRADLGIRLYCGQNMRGAFESVKNGVLILSESMESASDPRVTVTIGESIKYMQVAARRDLGIEGSEEDVEAARTAYIAKVNSLSPNA